MSATEKSSHQSAYPWLNCNYLSASIPLGLATGYGIRSMDRCYLAYMNSTKYFQQVEPQRLVKPFLRSPSAQFFLRFRIVCLAPVVEEFLFRGVHRDTQIRENRMQYGEESTGAKVQRMVLNAAFFSVVHFDYRQSFRSNVRLAPPLLASGIAFNLLMEATDSIVAPVIGHSLVNLLALRGLRR